MMSIPVEMMEDFGAITVGFLVLFLLVYLIFIGVAVLMYVFHALSLYSTQTAFHWYISLQASSPAIW